MAFASPSIEVDWSLVSELYDAIEKNPKAVEPWRILLEQFVASGMNDNALGAAQELLKLDPNDAEARNVISAFGRPATMPPPHPDSHTKSRLHRMRNPKPWKSAALTVGLETPTVIDGDLAPSMNKLSTDCETLRTKAKAMQDQLIQLRKLQPHDGVDAFYTAHMQDITDLAEGRLTSTVKRNPIEKFRDVARTLRSGRLFSTIRPTQSTKPRHVAKSMSADAGSALEAALSDLTDMAHSLGVRDDASDEVNDRVRDALVKRAQALSAALPPSLKSIPSTALMHIEHEILGRKYQNDETMQFDPVSEIPRANFWVSEDGYAWDMEELAQAITANGGVMRNPFSRTMFTPDDVKSIVDHPLGKSLAALQVEQGQLLQGIRSETIKQLDDLGKVILEDQSLDQIPSRHAIDAFLAYCATLPQSEQKAIDKLKVPARDSHTGQSFDTTIGKSIKDAKGNEICMHKTGDLLTQAVRYLRSR